MKHVVIIGASGHGKVIANIIQLSGDQVVGFLDDDYKKTEVYGLPILGEIKKAEKFQKYEFIIAIGNNYIRKKIAEHYSYLKYYTAIHPSAIIDKSTIIKKGSVIMASAVINAESKIGRHCIINTASIIEHDNIIGDYVHISPNATLSGTVSVGKCSHIGAGATVINNVNIVDNVIVGAGSVVIKDLKDSGTYVGAPAKLID